MNPKIWTPRYVKNRICLYIHEQFNKDKPWIAPSAIKWLDDKLNKKMSGIEFGSGRSTIWYAKRLKSLVSIEDHQEWFERVQEDLRKSKVDNVSHLFKSSKKDNSGKIPYAQAVDEFEANSLDFIVIDGKYRDVLALKSITKLVAGGYLLLDDAERYVPLKTHAPYSYLKVRNDQEASWKKFSDLTNNWEQVHFSSGVSDTVIFIKP